MDSNCYRMLRHISPAAKTSPDLSSLRCTDFQSTASAILQCRPHLKALGSELKLSRKINKNSGVKIVVDSFAPLAWTELSKPTVTVTCVGLVSGCETWPRQEHHKAQSAKHMCVCTCTHTYVRDHAHTIYTLRMYTHSKWCVNTCITSVRLHSCRIQQRVMFMYASPFQPLHGCVCMYSHTWLYKLQGKPLHCTLTSPREENMTAQKLRDAGHTTPPPGKNTHSAMGKTA